MYALYHIVGHFSITTLSKKLETSLLAERLRALNKSFFNDKISAGQF